MDVGRDPKPIEPTRSLFILFYLCFVPSNNKYSTRSGRARPWPSSTPSWRACGTTATSWRRSWSTRRVSSVLRMCVVSPPLYLCPCVGACIIPTHPPPTLQPNPTQLNTTQLTPKNPKQKITARDFEAPLKRAIERVKALKADIKAGACASAASCV